MAMTHQDISNATKELLEQEKYITNLNIKTGLDSLSFSGMVNIPEYLRKTRSTRRFASLQRKIAGISIRVMGDINGEARASVEARSATSLTKQQQNDLHALTTELEASAKQVANQVNHQLLSLKAQESRMYEEGSPEWIKINMASDIEALMGKIKYYLHRAVEANNRDGVAFGNEAAKAYEDQLRRLRSELPQPPTVLALPPAPTQEEPLKRQISFYTREDSLYQSYPNKEPEKKPYIHRLSRDYFDKIVQSTVAVGRKGKFNSVTVMNHLKKSMRNPPSKTWINVVRRALRKLRAVKKEGLGFILRSVDSWASLADRAWNRFEKRD